jgi:hypothetical protein
MICVYFCDRQFPIPAVEWRSSARSLRQLPRWLASIASIKSLQKPFSRTAPVSCWRKTSEGWASLCASFVRAVDESSSTTVTTRFSLTTESGLQRFSRARCSKSKAPPRPRPKARTSMHVGGAPGIIGDQRTRAQRGHQMNRLDDFFWRRWRRPAQVSLSASPTVHRGQDGCTE